MDDNLFIEALLQKSKARREFMIEAKKSVSTERKRFVSVDKQQMNTESQYEELPKRQCSQVPQVICLPAEEKFNMAIKESDTFISFNLEHEVEDRTTLKKNCFAGNKSALVQKSINDNAEPAELPLSAKKALFENSFFGGVPKIFENVVIPKRLVAQRTTMFENASKLSQFSKVEKCRRTMMKNSSKTVQAVSTSPVKDFMLSHSNATAFKINSQEMQDDANICPPISLILSPTKNNRKLKFIQQYLNEQLPFNVQGKEIAIKAAKESQQEICNSVNYLEKLSSCVENSSEMYNCIVHKEKNAFSSEEQSSCGSDVVPELLDYNKCNSDGDNKYIENEYERKVSPKYYDGCPNIDESIFDFHDISEIESSVSLGSNYSEDLNNSSKQDGISISNSFTSSASSNQNYFNISSYSDDSSYNASKSKSSSSSSVSSYDVESIKSNESTPSVIRQNKNSDMPLLHTVNFYKKQKQETRITPVYMIERHGNIQSSDSSDMDHTQIIQDHVKALQNEILKEQSIINQISQALNFCNATVKFSGSYEQMEGERLLLIATQKYQAYLSEIQYLKTCNPETENISDGEGTLTITNMQLPLKKQFISSQLDGKKNDDVYYFLCLIRHRVQVIGTQMISTNDKISNGVICFSNHIKLKNLSSDFCVVLEVYTLQTKKNVLSHEKKYHKQVHSKRGFTHKSKKSADKMLMSAVSSPGNSNAVKSPSFGSVGFTCITLQNCSKKTFTLNNVLFASPLDGVLKVKLGLHVEHRIIEKGFLTIFEEGNDFGAWHRRWCVLSTCFLEYWKYPVDEHKKESVGTIDLKQCVTGEIKPISKEVCARPHTFQLDTVRSQEKDDKNTLISRISNTSTCTKYLLAADTKEETIHWCNKLNKALANVRKWDLPSVVSH